MTCISLLLFAELALHLPFLLTVVAKLSTLSLVDGANTGKVLVSLPSSRFFSSEPGPNNGIP